MPPLRIPSVSGTWNNQQIRIRPDRLVVSVRPGVRNPESILAGIPHLIETHAHTPAIAVYTPGRRWAVFKFAPLSASQILDLAGLIKASDQRIRYVEPAIIGELHLMPDNTPDYQLEWWPDTIHMPDAWDLTTGNNKVLLGIMDTGISMTGSSPDHPDLKDPPTRYIVRHGTVRHDYVIDDDIPRDEHYDGHGTHVAGIASADGNNGIGVAGVNWECPVYIARVADACGSFGSDDLKNAVADLLDYATGVYDRVVVNMSMGVAPEPEHLREMCEDAASFAGKVLFVCAAGENPADENNVALDWPSAYAADFDFVVAVGGTYEDDTPCDPDRDNYDAITIFAPGNAIHSTMPTYARDPCTDKYGVVHPSGATDYGDLGGTSMAAPMVAGVASLMWTVNNGLSAADIIALLRSSARIIPYKMKVTDKVTGVVTEIWTSHYRLDAHPAVKNALPMVDLEEAHVLFADVAVGEPVEQSLIFHVGTECTVTFEVVEASIALAGTLSVTPLAAGYNPGMGGLFNLITVKYQPAVAGDISYGTFRVKSPEACREWTIFVTASAAAGETTTATILVADRSGSMAEWSGIESLTRMQVLQEASSILVETLRIGDGIGVVGFSTEANVAAPLTSIVSAEPTSVERVNIKAKIAALAAGGTTSIGAGVELAAGMVSSDARPLRGIMVLTDGHENTAPFISGILGGVHTSVYAIGMGTVEALQPDTLMHLTEDTGGYLLLTDKLDARARFRVAKYAMQMLANITGESLVLDPTTVLRPRQRLPIPFSLCSDDRFCAVTLLTPWPDLVQMKVLGPGQRGVPEHGGGIQRITGTSLISHRFPLPAEDVHAGEWSVVLSIDESAERELKERSAAAGYQLPGAPCSVLVTARSAVRMTCRALAASRLPGSVVTLRASVSRRGRGYDENVRVGATIRRRDDEALRISLTRSAPGIFEGTFTASQNGVYECVIRASGSIPGAERFCREQTVTAHIWAGDSAAIDLERARAREMSRVRPDS